jgi:anthranilate phosphoribosyltransferase
MLDELIRGPGDQAPLTDARVRQAVEQLVDPGISAEIKANFLSRLAVRGETVQEIAAFVRELRDRAVTPPIDDQTRSGEILDVCGTGGDRLNTFNISTTVALICASAGIPVAKHGNRAITSQAGSADVLEALGVRIDLPPAEAARSLRERQFAFFLAPNYHPAFKHIAAARKLCAERGQRTIFNFLGPLLNPVRPTAQLIGVPRPELCEPVARVLQMLGVHRGMVVSGKIEESHMDEFSTLGETTVAEFYQERGFSCSVLSSAQFPVALATLADLRGGDAKCNAGIVARILDGDERGPKRDAVLLNTSAALLVAGRARSISEGWDHAVELIDSAKAAKKLKQLQQHN